MQKKCSKCEKEFICVNESGGCWCERVQLSIETLQSLKDNFDNCLCSFCLKNFEKSSEA
jgi:hypothetical protein